MSATCLIQFSTDGLPSHALLSKHSGPRSTAQRLRLLGDELVCYGWYRVLTFERIYFAADRRDPGFRSPTAAIRVSARRPPQSEFPLAAVEPKGNSGNQTKRGLWYKEYFEPLCKNLIWSILALWENCLQIKHQQSLFLKML